MTCRPVGRIAKGDGRLLAIDDFFVGNQAFENLLATSEMTRDTRLWWVLVNGYAMILHVYYFVCLFIYFCLFLFDCLFCFLFWLSFLCFFSLSSSKQCDLSSPFIYLEVSTINNTVSIYKFYGIFLTLSHFIEINMMI